MIWFTGSALGIAILMIAGLVVVILVKGLSFFWPKPLEQVTLKDGSIFLGEITNRGAIPNPGQPDHLLKQRILLRVGNRDLYGFDFKWVNEDEIEKRETPRDAYFIERREYGALIGMPVAVKEADRTLAAETAPPEQLLPGLIENLRMWNSLLRRHSLLPYSKQNLNLSQFRPPRSKTSHPSCSTDFRTESCSYAKRHTCQVRQATESSSLSQAHLLTCVPPSKPH